MIAGGSVSAVTCASTLRHEGYDDEIVLLSEESHEPYSRVPLSKGVLAGTEHPDETALPTLPDSIGLRLGVRAMALDPTSRVVITSTGERVPYDGLVVATGARARRLAAPGQEGERVLRDLCDATDLARDAAHARSAVVVGAGFLGMEIASTLSGLGLEVTVVDREPGLERVLGPWLAERVR